MIRIIVVDDHELMRDGLVRILELQQDFEVVGEAGSGGEAINLCKTIKPDLVLLDFSLPDMDGFDVVSRIMIQAPLTKILVVTMHDNEEYAKRLIELGAKGYAIKGTSSKELIKAIHSVIEGKIYLSPAIIERIAFSRFTDTPDENPLNRLTTREIQIFTRLAKGMRNNDIGDELCISPSTVNTYRRRIMDKFNVNNKSGLVKIAIKAGMLDSE